MDDRKAIPFAAVMNLAIIERVKVSKAFMEACVNIPKENGVTSKETEEWPFFNPSWGCYLMYTQFVVTKELYNLPKDDNYYIELIEKDVMADFTVHRERYSFEKRPDYYFNSFRNSISHVNFKFNEGLIILWDHFKDQTDPDNWHWHVEIELKKFLNFLGHVADANIKLYNEIKEGKRNDDGTRL